MEKKICTKCNKEYTIDKYYTITNKKTGRKYTYNYCKYCHYEKMTKETAAKWREDNPERWNKLVVNNLKVWRKKMQGGVYCIITQKGLYIGSSDTLKLRIQQHKLGKTKGTTLYDHGAKYMKHFILSRTDNPKTRFEKEKKWIEILKPALNKEWNPDVWYKDPQTKQYIKK